MRKLAKVALWAGIVTLVAGGAYLYTTWNRRLIPSGSVRIDPQARIDPSRSYQIVVWVPEAPLPWDRGAHRGAVSEAAEQFARVFPNIEIRVEFLPWHEGHARLREALALGQPPDVYAMPQGARKVSDELQVPAGPYLSEESRADHLPRALELVHLDGYEWAWPTWIRPHVWVARADLHQELAQSIPAWTAAHLEPLLARIRQESGVRGLALNPFDPSLFMDVMARSTGRNLIGPDGERAWSVEEMEAALAFFASMIERGLTWPNAEAMSRARLAHFWNRQAALVAPVNPWLLRHLLVRGGALNAGDTAPESARRQAAVVPPPAVGDESGSYPATVGGFVLFRQREYKGDDHTKAAAMVAEHLARRLGPWEAAQLLAVPAHPTTWDAWRADAALPEPVYDLFVLWASRAVAPPVHDDHAHQQQKAAERVIAAQFPRLWQGDAPRQIAEAIALHVDGLRAEVPAASIP